MSFNTPTGHGSLLHFIEINSKICKKTRAAEFALVHLQSWMKVKVSQTYSTVKLSNGYHYIMGRVERNWFVNVRTQADDKAGLLFSFLFLHIKYLFKMRSPVKSSLPCILTGGDKKMSTSYQLQSKSIENFEITGAEVHTFFSCSCIPVTLNEGEGHNPPPAPPPPPPKKVKKNWMKSAHTCPHTFFLYNQQSSCSLD